MAKPKAPATEPLVETVQDNDFAEPIDPAIETTPRGADREADIDAIRVQRAAQRAARGRGGKKRVITHYHDAERLRNLGLLSAEEYVDCEEAGLFPDPKHYHGADQGAVDSVPPDEGV